MNYSNTSSMSNNNDANREFVFSIIRSCLSKDDLKYLNQIIEQANAQKSIIEKYNGGDMIRYGR